MRFLPLFFFLYSFSLFSQQTFQEHFNENNNYYMNEIESGDFNGDGKLDFVLSSHGSRTILTSITGDFFDNSSFNVINEDENVRNLKVVDIDGDDDYDFLGTDVFADKTYLWLNDGTGEFSKNELSIGAYQSIGHIDIDQDSISELLIGIGNDLRIYKYASNDLTLENTVISNTSYGAPKGVVSYVDGNGDLTIAANFGFNRLRFFKQNNSGVFDLQEENLSLTNSNELFPTDIDGDGDIDLLAFNEFQDKTYLIIKEENGYNANELPTESGWYNPLSNFGDIDDDGDIDVLYIEKNSDGGEMISLLINTNGILEKQLISDTHSSNESGHIADLDNDGDQDIVIFKNQTFDRGFLFFENVTMSAVRSNAFDLKVSVYPTKVIDAVNIEINGNFVYRVFNALGQQCSQGEGRDALSISCSEWSKGAYLIEVQQLDKKGISRVFKY